MLEHVIAFSKGGIVLWSYSFDKLRGNPINNLIRSVLLEERSGQQSYADGVYTVKWEFANEYDLVFAVVYQTALSSSVKYVDDLVATIKQKFCNDYKSVVTSKHPLEEVDFTGVFKAILAKCEERAKEIKGPKSFWDTKKGKEVAKTRKDDPKTDAKKPGKPGRAVTQDNNVDDGDEDIDSAEVNGAQDSFTPTVVEEQSSESSDGLSTSEIEKNRQRMMAKLTAKKGGAKKAAASNASASPARRIKENAPGWGEKRMTKAEIEKLNFGPSEGGDPLSQFQGSGFDPNSRATSLDDSDGEEDDLIDDDEIVDTKKDAEKKKPTGGLMGFFKSFSIIGKELSRDDVDPVLQQIKTHLVSKNVASDIAEQLAESVGSSLVGKQMGSFTRSYLLHDEDSGVSTVVKEAMQQALTKILTPKRNIDILREIQDAKAQKRPYTIVFVGVNGVGKSTSLSKVCSWLQAQQLKVLIAACDTFRAGAIEQLQVHARNLGVPVYHQGYGKDAASIAKEGINKAQKEGMDVVLIDTAGRMQDNEPLMQALAKVIKVNNPDLIIFVGEALVGHDSVDQLTKFNASLEQYGDLANPRVVDGIFLSKFDTVDDKVGAAISMVYTTGQPIIFIGVGQNYADIRTLNTKRIVNILFKGRI